MAPDQVRCTQVWIAPEWTTKDLEVRRTNVSTQRPESLTLYIKYLHRKAKASKDLLCKDIALRDVVPWEEDTKDHPCVFPMGNCSYLHGQPLMNLRICVTDNRKPSRLWYLCIVQYTLENTAKVLHWIPTTMRGDTLSPFSHSQMMMSSSQRLITPIGMSWVDTFCSTTWLLTTASASFHISNHKRC